MKRLLRYFLQGLVITVPLLLTVFVCVQAFRKVDSWLGISTMGQAPASITLVGFFGSSVLTKTLIVEFEKLLERLPFVRLVYASTKDLLNAFVGEKRRFDKPVLVSLTPDGAIKGLGFITQESLASLGEAGSVVVYFPQSYAFAGWTFVVPATRVSRVDMESSDFMAFVVSGGVTGVPGTGTHTAAAPLIPKN
ncbi:MAG: DUF502 domain-containing protein [Betaproteobacteria bacterium]|nr:DUF502 domain-containing protein [Betaproteobacteria bacterium]